MLVNGEWLFCQDGGIRPTVTGLVRVPDGQLFEAPFLLDAGADRTVLSADFLSLLVPLQSSEAEQIHLAGVGGRGGSITVDTAIGFSQRRWEGGNH